MNSSSDTTPWILKANLKFSRFRAGLSDDLRIKLLAPKITELEKAYTLVQDLDAAKSIFISKSHTQTTKPNSSSYPNRFQSQTFAHWANTKGKSVENKSRALTESSLNWLPQSCYKCQGYGHMAANCSSPIKIDLVNGVLEEVSDSDSDEFIFQGED